MKNFLIFLFILPLLCFCQQEDENYDTLINKNLGDVLMQHKEFVSIPNLPVNPKRMLENIEWVQKKYEKLNFTTRLLPSETLPILLVEKEYDPSYKTILFYFHIDGQPVYPDAWDQQDPFVPELKELSSEGYWQKVDWEKLEGTINDEWRIFGRAAADDKAPIMMFLTALELLEQQNKKPQFNIKVIFDPEEEYSSTALLATLDTYKSRYTSDYFIVMDGPAHDSNKPTLTFGCRGIATCSITTYGAKLPQHSGHYGNYAPNPVFRLANVLSSMKDDAGRVLISNYYEGISIDSTTNRLLESVPFNKTQFNSNLGIATSEKVGDSYQEALQYPSLNVRQIGTSWKGQGLKTVVPEYAKADIDVRLVPETDGQDQLDKIAKHIRDQGYYVINRPPTDSERLEYSKIATFIGKTSVNAFRTDPEAAFGMNIRRSLEKSFGEEPISIRLMGGTVPIVPLITALNVPTVIIPMVNMDNNQHNPNENIRIGNMRQGIKMCMVLLDTDFD